MRPRIPSMATARTTRMTITNAMVLLSIEPVLPPALVLPAASLVWLLPPKVVVVDGLLVGIGMAVMIVLIVGEKTSAVWLGPAGTTFVATTCRLRPGESGCVSRISKSASLHRICIAGPTVTAAFGAVAKPQTPPRKSVISVVQLIPIGTQYATFSPGTTLGNPSVVLAFVKPQLGPTANPCGQMAGE
jgi:hypothetical protein